MLTFLMALSVKKLSEKMSHLVKFPSKNDQIMWYRVQCVEEKILCDINPFLCVKKLFPSDIPFFFFYFCSKGGQNIFSLKNIKGAKIPKKDKNELKLTVLLFKRAEIMLKNASTSLVKYF